MQPMGPQKKAGRLPYDKNPRSTCQLFKIMSFLFAENKQVAFPEVHPAHT
jgi:hypothetical protein